LDNSKQKRTVAVKLVVQIVGYGYTVTVTVMFRRCVQHWIEGQCKFLDC